MGVFYLPIAAFQGGKNVIPASLLTHHSHEACGARWFATQDGYVQMEDATCFSPECSEVLTMSTRHMQDGGKEGL